MSIRGSCTAVALTLLLPAALVRAQDKPKPAAADDNPKAPAAAGPDGFLIESDSGDYRLHLAGYLQLDGRFYGGDSANLGTDTFLIRRARPIFQGTVARIFDFYLDADFGLGTTTLFDAYLDARFTPAFRLRAGKFKSPVGLERLQSGSNLLFVERALPSAVAPNRDEGLQLHGEVLHATLAYQIALLNGVLDGTNTDGDVNDAKDVAARLFVQPFRNGKGPLRGLGLGVSGTAGKQDGALTQTYRSPGQIVFFNYVTGVTQDGVRRRLSPQGYFYAGPFGLLGEYVVSTQRVLRERAAARIRAEAWQAAASVLLTHEKASYSPVKPARPFDPAKGRWGAFELAARVHGLGVDEDAFTLGFADPRKSARKVIAWTLGLNWTLNRNVKYVVNYEHSTFTGGATSGDRPTEKTILARAQVLF